MENDFTLSNSQCWMRVPKWRDGGNDHIIVHGYWFHWVARL